MSDFHNGQGTRDDAPAIGFSKLGYDIPVASHVATPHEPALPRSIPYAGYGQRYPSADDPNFDPTIPHECHCQRCDHAWMSTPYRQFPPNLCSSCRAAKWWLPGTPKQQEAYRNRVRREQTIAARIAMERRIAYLLKRARVIIMELLELDANRETRDLLSETIAADDYRKKVEKARVAKEERDPAPPAVAAFDIPSSASELLPPPPPAPRQWDVRAPMNTPSAMPPRSELDGRA